MIEATEFMKRGQRFTKAIRLSNERIVKRFDTKLGYEVADKLQIEGEHWVVTHNRYVWSKQNKLGFGCQMISTHFQCLAMKHLMF